MKATNPDTRGTTFAFQDLIEAKKGSNGSNGNSNGSSSHANGNDLEDDLDWDLIHGDRVNFKQVNCLRGRS